MQNATENIISLVNEVNETFRTHFSIHGYSEIRAEPVSSKVDPTVRFIGSPISILKPIIVESKVTLPGIFAIQKCLRTRYQSRIFDLTFNPERMSLFTQCALYSIADETVAATLFFELMFKYFRENLTALEIHVWHEDYALREIIERSNFLNIPVVFDYNNENKFRHRYGNTVMYGRNLNVMFSSLHGNKLEIANFIMVDCQGCTSGYEIAIGSNMVTQAHLNCAHILDTTSTNIIYSSVAAKDFVFRDSLLVCCYLLKEGVEPTCTHAQNISLRTYLKSLCARIIIHDLEHKIYDLVTDILMLEFGVVDENIIRKIMLFLSNYKDKLFLNNKLSNEDKKVLTLIKTYA